MRAVRMHGTGDPSVLRVDDVPEPGPPRGDELLVAVSASSVNGSDLGLRRGGMRVLTTGREPHRLGFDLVGRVLAAGPAVTAFEVGDRVMALLGHAGGAQAERVLLSQTRAAPVPDEVPDEVAAALPLAGLTALQALHRVGVLRGRSAPGRAPRALVLGASGGIGSFAVPLARLAGAHVTAVTGAATVEAVRGWGADEVVDRTRQDVTGLDGRWDLVLDAAGHYRYADLRPLLSDGGGMVSVRPVSPDAWRALGGAVPRARGRRRPRAYGFVATAARSQDLAHLGRLVARGLLVPAVDSVLPLDRVAEAHRRAEGGAAGKVVLRLQPG